MRLIDSIVKWSFSLELREVKFNVTRGWEAHHRHVHSYGINRQISSDSYEEVEHLNLEYWSVKINETGD